MSKVKPTTKPPISLIPAEAILEEAKAFQYGASKHGRFGFREGVEYSKLIDAAFRHLLAISKGEDVDQESGCLHAAAVRANMAMLIWTMENKIGMDDRFKKDSIRVTKQVQLIEDGEEIVGYQDYFKDHVMFGSKK